MTARVEEAASSLLSRHGGRVGDIAWQVGGALLAAHMDPQRIKVVLGGKCNVEGWQGLVEVAEKGVPVGVSEGGDLWKELAYDSHRSVQKHKSEVLRKAMPDVALD